MYKCSYTCVDAHHLCAWCPRKLEEGFGSPVTNVVDHCEQPFGCLGIRPRFSERVVSALNFWSISPAPVHYLISIYMLLFLRQGLTMQSRLALNLLRRSSSPRTHRVPACLCFLRTGIKGVDHHTPLLSQLKTSFLHKDLFLSWLWEVLLSFFQRNNGL